MQPRNSCQDRKAQSSLTKLRDKLKGRLIRRPFHFAHQTALLKAPERQSKVAKMLTRARRLAVDESPSIRPPPPAQPMARP
jgi:hypothetical protein